MIFFRWQIIGSEGINFEICMTFSSGAGQAGWWSLFLLERPCRWSIKNTRNLYFLIVFLIVKFLKVQIIKCVVNSVQCCWLLDSRRVRLSEKSLILRFFVVVQVFPVLNTSLIVSTIFVQYWWHSNTFMKIKEKYDIQ